jgi:hypothetical protein
VRPRYFVEPCDNLGSLNPPPPRDRTWIVRDRQTGQQQSEHDRRADARADAARLNTPTAQKDI